MSIKHLKNLGKVLWKEGFSQAVKYDFDKSSFRLLIPYAAELAPTGLGLINYQTLTNNMVKKEGNKFLAGCSALGSEAARYIITAVVLNETKSVLSAALAYSLATSFFSTRNQLKVNRFYQETPDKRSLIEKIKDV